LASLWATVTLSLVKLTFYFKSHFLTFFLDGGNTKPQSGGKCYLMYSLII
jgi:hypothetical protein